MAQGRVNECARITDGVIEQTRARLSAAESELAEMLVLSGDVENEITSFLRRRLELERRLLALAIHAKETVDGEARERSAEVPSRWPAGADAHRPG